MIKKILGIILISISIFSVSYGADWTYYQIRESTYNSNKSNINNQLFNNNVNSSYYVDKGSLSDGDKINKIEGEIKVFVVEEGDFQELAGFNVQDYNGASDYFTAMDGGNDYSSAICSTFDGGKINISKNSNEVYKRIRAGGSTIDIKISDRTNDMSNIVQNNAKIINDGNGLYNNCNDPISGTLGYRIVYETQYFYDKSAPTLGSMNYTDSDGDSYNPGTDGWIDESIDYSVNCIDEPSSYSNAGCKTSTFSDSIDTHQVSSSPLQITTIDNLINRTTRRKSVSIPIDKTDPELGSNELNLKGDIYNKNYTFNTSDPDEVILADKYTISFDLKDPGISCDSTDTNCKGVSGIDTVDIKKSKNSGSYSNVCSKNYSQYNPTFTKKDSQEKRLINCNNIVLTDDNDYTLKLIIKDYAGNVTQNSWDIDVEPNEPDTDEFTISCTNCGGANYFSTNEDNDTYNYDFIINDHWGNRITKNIRSVDLTDGSYIDKNIYDGNNSDDGNIIKKINENLGVGNGSFELSSIVPGNIKDKFKFTIQGYNKHYNNDTDFVKTKDFGGNYTYNQSITTGDIWAEDSSGNVVSYTGLVPNTEYTLNFDITSSGFNNDNYKYEIKNIFSTLEAKPNSYYDIKYTGGLINDSKGYRVSPQTISFNFKYEFIGSGPMDKELGLEFNPSITIEKNGKEGTYGIGTYNYGNSTKDKDFNFLVVGNKSSKGNSSSIGETSEINLNSSTARTKIRKKAFNLINGLQNGTNSNGIYYINGDYELDSTEYQNLKSNGVETLVVKDGSLNITTNIEERLDIAVITTDNDYGIYNSSINDINNYISNYKDKGGNIILDPNVSMINGLIYTDKSILPGDGAGNILKPDASNRSALLNKQLIFYGSLISRNTIGGSILKNNKYTLPGGKKISKNNLNYNKALFFDIAFMRVGNDGYMTTPNKNYNKGKDAYVMTRYNSDLQVNPSDLIK